MTLTTSAKPSLPRRRSPSSPITRHGRSNIHSTSISTPSAIWWNAASVGSSSFVASQLASRRPPEITVPSSLSLLSSYGCAKCPHHLKRAGERAAVEQDILAGDKACLGAAQKRAGEAKFLGIAEASGGIEFRPFRQHLIHTDTAFLGFRLCNRAAQPVGIEWTRQQAIDGDVVDHGLARKAGDEAGKA